MANNAVVQKPPAPIDLCDGGQQRVFDTGMIGIAEHHFIELASKRRSEIALKLCHACESIVQLQRPSSSKHRSYSGRFNDDGVS